MPQNISPQDYYGDNVSVKGKYQFTSLKDIINQFMIVYVGEDKIIPKAKRTDVAFHAQRGLAELSFDTLKSCKSQEITVPASLKMTLPYDYVNYTKISWVDSAGIKHLLYPTSKTSNPVNPFQNSDGEFKLKAVGTMINNLSTITLDAEYKNILVGMAVSSPNIPTKSFVFSTSNNGGITTIQIMNALGVAVPTTYTGTETLTFDHDPDNLSALTPVLSSFVLENITYAALENKLTQSPNTDVSNIKVGMVVYNKAVKPGTKVIDVTGDVITISTLISGATFTPAANTEFTFAEISNDSDTWASYKSATPSENQDDYQDDTYWPMDGSRYGLDPQHAQANGSFYIDCVLGKIHFSSNIAGKTVILDYISDTLGSEGEMQVHKFAEEAMYKWISYAILSGKANVPEYQVLRLKKERFAAIRTAKLRLSNFKLEELTQILRGKSKQIKH